MAFGTSESLTGLLCWEAIFGLAFLMMDESRFCILQIEDVPENLLGAMVHISGKRLADSVVAVENITPLGVRLTKK